MRRDIDHRPKIIAMILVFTLAIVIISAYLAAKQPQPDTQVFEKTNVVEPQTTAVRLPIKKKVLVGKFEITHYWPWVTGTGITKSEKWAEDGVDKWVASNPEDFPIGTELYIDGYGYRTVEDTGVGQGHIDILVVDQETAIKLGRIKNVNVYIIKEEF